MHQRNSYTEFYLGVKQVHRSGGKGRKKRVKTVRVLRSRTVHLKGCRLIDGW